MLSIMQIDGLGKRYGMLPSEVLRKADTFDLYVIDAALTYENYQHKKAMNNGQVPAEMYSTEQLVEMHNKGKDNGQNPIANSKK
jgi:hypothetical protein